LGDLRADGRIILKWIFKKWDAIVDWMDLAQNRYRWRAVLLVVIKVRFHKMRGLS
jgi:hypothetical protein